MLRPVETHIRVMSHPTRFGLAPVSFQINELESVTCSGQTRLHSPKLTNRELYEEIVRPTVSNALAGQSHTLLFVGPPNSGRSHTMYGGPSEQGMLHFLAEELLAAGPSVIVDVSGYKTNEGQLSDINGDRPVAVKALQPPIGLAVLAQSVLLTRVGDAMLLPKRRGPSDSVFVQFRIYRRMDGATLRSAFAVITLVDVAAVTAPAPPHDFTALNTTIQRIVNGSNDRFDRCALTQVLENSLIGSTALICIATVTGRDDAVDATAATVRFIDAASRLNQVVSLIHFIPPPHLAESVRQWSAVEDKLRLGVAAATDAGVANVVKAVERHFSQKELAASECWLQFSRRCVALREDIGQQLRSALLDCAPEACTIESATQQCHRDADEYSAKALANEREMCDLKAKVDRTRDAIQHQRTELEQQMILHEMKISQLDTNIAEGRACQDRFRNERHAYQATRAAAEEISATYHEQWVFEAARLRFDKEMTCLGSKRARLEAGLSAASESAAVRANRERTLRERKSRLSLVQGMEMQVSQLRQRLTVQSPTAPSFDNGRGDHRATAAALLSQSNVENMPTGLVGKAVSASPKKERGIPPCSTPQRTPLGKVSSSRGPSSSPLPQRMLF